MNQGVTTGVSEARSHQRRGKKTPTLVTPTNIGREAKGARVERVLKSDPPKRSYGCRETSGPPINRAEPKTLRGVPAAKVARASRERTRCGYTQFDWVADIGWTHCASSPPGGRKACW